MKIAVTSTSESLTSEIDPRFGRAECFIIVDPQTLDWKPVPNTQQMNLPQGAGIQAGQTIVNQQVQVLITGHCGPKAFKILDHAGIKIMTGAKGSVMDAIHQYTKGELTPLEQADVSAHWI